MMSRSASSRRPLRRDSSTHDDHADVDGDMFGISPESAMPFPSSPAGPSNGLNVEHHDTQAMSSSPQTQPNAMPELDHRTESAPAVIQAFSDFHSTHSLSGSALFRASVQRLIRMKRVAEDQPGAEPGVDPMRDSTDYDHIIADCKIEIIDYGPSNATFRQYTNKGLLRVLSSVGKSRDDWVKVRWINIHGIDWSVIKAVSLVYGLHPLALEDVLHARDCRSKVDYYKDQLFLQGLAVLLKDPHPKDADHDNHDHPPESTPSWLRRTLFRRKTTDQDVETGRSPYLQGLPQRHGSASGLSNNSKVHLSRFQRNGRQAVALEKTLERLSGERRVHIKERNIYIFMFRDGTLITFHEAMDSMNDEAIINRLREPNTMLRGTSEVSVLLQSLLDLMVDHAVEVVDAIQEQIIHLEQETMLRPTMDSVRLLHLQSADITLHKRTLSPLRTLVYGMRRYDYDRCVALVASASGNPNPETERVRGFLSHQSKVYLSDVSDHLEYVISSLEMFETITENLISYSFNILSYDMNETMRRLTLATLIFFPLTFLTGYFGMNFADMPSINGSDVFFWKLAFPCTVGLILIFTRSDIVKMAQYVRFKNLAQRIHIDMIRPTRKPDSAMA